MALPKFTDDVNIHQSLSNAPNATEGYTPLQIKILFDKPVNLIKTWINDVLTVQIDAHMAETVAERKVVTRDTTLTGIQTISGLAGKPKRIDIVASVDGSKKLSIGGWGESGGQSGNYIDSATGNHYATSSAVMIANTTVNRTVGSIQNVINGSFDISWAHLGTGATGTSSLSIAIIYH